VQVRNRATLTPLATGRAHFPEVGNCQIGKSGAFRRKPFPGLFKKINSRLDGPARRLRLLTPTLEDLRSLHFRQFEDAIALSFARQGYAVEQTPYSHDGGYDGILRKEGHCWLYECKRYGDSGVSGRPDLQILHSAMTSQGAVGGMFITTGRFTKDALEFAKSANIRTIDGKQLVREMFDRNVGALSDVHYRTKCRQCGAEVEHSLKHPNTVSCPNRHAVAPSLQLGQVLSGEDLPTLDGRQITPDIVSAFKKAG
jgi:hypothetical protein